MNEIKETRKEKRTVRRGDKKMKRTMKRMKLSLIFITFAVIMLASSLAVGYVNAAINEQKEDSSTVALPDFLLRLSEYLSKGNKSELARIRHQMIEQEKVNRERIASTRGAVLTFSPSDDALLSGPPIYSFLLEVVKTSPWEPYGYIEYAYRMTGGQDNSYAHLHTTDWNHDYGNPQGGEAFAAGYMYRYSGQGDIYVRCRRGSGYPSYQDYVIVYTSNDINALTWDYRGYAQVPSTSATNLYIGTVYSTFRCISISCWTPPQAPVYYEPLIKNCVYVDNVYTLRYW